MVLLTLFGKDFMLIHCFKAKAFKGVLGLGNGFEGDLCESGKGGRDGMWWRRGVAF